MQLTKQRLLLNKLERQKNIIWSVQEERLFPAEFSNFGEMIIESFPGLYQKMREEYELDRAGIEKFQKCLIVANHELRRVAPKKLWFSLARVLDFPYVYNPGWYELRKKKLEDAGLKTEALVLTVRYEGLKKCIDTESVEKLSYNENFGMAADKIAVQHVFNFIEQEVLQVEFSLSPNAQFSKKNKTKIIVTKDENDEHLCNVTYGETTISLNKTTQIGVVVAFVSQNKRLLALPLCKKLFSEDIAQDMNDLSDMQIKKLRSIFSDVNRWFKNNFKLTTVLHIRRIKSGNKNKVFIKRSSIYW